MSATAITDATTGRLLRWGQYQETAQAGEVLHALIDGTTPPEPDLTYTTVQAGAFRAMTAAERTAVDAQIAAQDAAQAAGAVRISRILATTAGLPQPPPRPGLLVALRDGGAGKPAIAISGLTNWAIFDSTRTI